MATPRSQIVDVNTTPYYHCMSKCVRGSFLCGLNNDTKRDYSHRKQWIADRLQRLSQVFAIQVCSYAVMSNHYHLLLYVNIDLVDSWDDETVLKRWESLFPISTKKYPQLPPEEQRQLIELWRGRLMSLSWFMRCLNEDIARRSNIEDDCKGRFWAGRFLSQALLDDEALLAAMVYVDLNPIRACIATTPEESDFTAIQERIRHVSKEIGKKLTTNTQELKSALDQASQPITLMPFLISRNPNPLFSNLNFTFSEYLEILDYTSREPREDKRGFVSEFLPNIFDRIAIKPKNWCTFVSNLKSFSYAIGSAESLKHFGGFVRKRALKGSTLAKACF